MGRRVWVNYVLMYMYVVHVCMCGGGGGGGEVWEGCVKY